MPKTRLRLAVPTPGWDEVRAELGVPEAFPPEVLAEAEAARPDLGAADARDLPLLTIDPPGSVDLDQAMALSRDGDGYRVDYAIADVAAFVRPGGAVDQEAHRRGVTLYAPDRRTPLHPAVLSEDRASLLPDQVRPAVLWTLRLDGHGELRGTQVRRAVVRSRQRLDYATVQGLVDAGSAPPELALLREIGELRLAAARARGAVDLPSLEQEVSAEGALTFRAPLPAEGWNAQISLLTGMAAARLMLDGGIGLLRTLPEPDPKDVAELRHSALALGVPWPEGTGYGELVSALDPAQPAAAALLTLATRLLRGAGYTAFAGSPPQRAEHSAVAAPYAHCTAPLRRLADRYVLETCRALCAGAPVPAWVQAALPQLPEEMEAADRRARALERAVVDLAEATVLQGRVGERFDAVVVSSSPKGGGVQLAEPAVRGRLDAVDPPLGARVSVRLVAADPARREVLFAL